MIFYEFDVLTTAYRSLERRRDCRVFLLIRYQSVDSAVMYIDTKRGGEFCAVLILYIFGIDVEFPSIEIASSLSWSSKCNGLQHE